MNKLLIVCVLFMFGCIGDPEPYPHYYLKFETGKDISYPVFPDYITDKCIGNLSYSNYYEVKNRMKYEKHYIIRCDSGDYCYEVDECTPIREAGK